MKLNRDLLVTALHELTTLCAREDLDARIIVVGGAAMALSYSTERDPTRDIDCAILSSEQTHDRVFEIAKDVGRQLGLTDGWFNSSARLFLPDFGEPYQWKTYEVIGRTTVWIAPPEMLFAMKLLAGRPNRDLDDLDVLADILSLTSEEEARAVFDRFYPHDDVARHANAWLKRRFSN